MTIGEETLREWEALTAAATPGPWLWDGHPVHPSVLMGEGGELDIVDGGNPYGDMIWPEPNRTSDQAFIARSRDIVPALIAEVRALRAVVEASRGHECPEGAEWCALAAALQALDKRAS